MFLLTKNKLDAYLSQIVFLVIVQGELVQFRRVRPQVVASSEVGGEEGDEGKEGQGEEERRSGQQMH